MADTRSDPQYKLRLTSVLKDLIDEHAERAGRSINQEIIFRLMEAYSRRPDYETHQMQSTFASSMVDNLMQSVFQAEQKLNIVMQHVYRGDHPDTWGDASLFRGIKRDELFVAARAYADELGPPMLMTDVLFMCAEKWLEHVGRLAPSKVDETVPAAGSLERRSES